MDQGAWTRPELEIAFRVHVVVLVMKADGRVLDAEREHYYRLFPRAKLIEHGFVGEEGQFTERMERAQQAALRRLPAQLSNQEKLEMLRGFHRAALADGTLEAHELQILFEGASFLGIDQEQFTHLMAELSLRHIARDAEA